MGIGDRFLLFLSVSFPHIELKQNFARPRLAAWIFIDSLDYALTLPERFIISLFVGRCSNPGALAARACFQFQKDVYVGFKQVAFSGFRVVCGDFKFIKLVDF